MIIALTVLKTVHKINVLNTAELVIIHANYLVNCSSLLSAVLIIDTFMCTLTLLL